MTHPAAVMAYVNPPVGEGRKPPAPLEPQLAMPTTAGRGQEATVAVLDLPEKKVKRAASPTATCACTQGIVDPELPRACPAEVTSSCGLDVVCHAVESFISKLDGQRARARVAPDDRPPYQGANPVSDVWSAKALEYGGRYLRRAVEDADDLEARGHMMFAASLGRHRLRLRGRAHPARLRLSDRRAQARLPAARLSGRPWLRPAGQSVIVTAPAAFRYTYEGDAGAAPARRRAARRRAGLLDADADTLPRC